MMDPRYRDVKERQIPEVVLKDGTRIKIICGRVDGPAGSRPGHRHRPGVSRRHRAGGLGIHAIPPAAATPSSPTSSRARAFFCPEKNPFSYEVEGVNYFDMQRDPCVEQTGMLVLFGDGDEVIVSTEDEAVRFLLISGKPLGEPVAWYGPIVMNTQEELRVAFEEYRNGTFIKHEK